MSDETGEGGTKMGYGDAPVFQGNGRKESVKWGDANLGSATSSTRASGCGSYLRVSCHAGCRVLGHGHGLTVTW